MSTPLVSACLIARDESAQLPRCLASLETLADEIVLVDTGSRDDTMQIASDHGAKVLERAWDGDFSAARNHGLAAAAGEFVVYIDCDEEVVADDVAPLRACIERGDHDVIEISVVSPIGQGSQKTNTIRYPRVFRRYPDARFERRIHEQIWPSLAPHQPRVLASPYRFWHYGYALDEATLAAKRRRNLDTALAVLAEHPDDPFYLHHAGLGHLTVGEQRTAIGFLERALRFATDPGLRACVLNTLAQTRHELRDDRTAERHAQESIATWPEQRHAWLLLADLRLLQSRHHDAIAALRNLLLTESSLPSDVSVERSVVLLKLGMCELLTHDATGAVAHLREALELGLDAGQAATAQRYLAMAARLQR